MMPWVSEVKYKAFSLMLLALFIIGLGFSIQQTALNPFVINLGGNEKRIEQII